MACRRVHLLCVLAVVGGAGARSVQFRRAAAACSRAERGGSPCFAAAAGDGDATAAAAADGPRPPLGAPAPKGASRRSARRRRRRRRPRAARRSPPPPRSATSRWSKLGRLQEAARQNHGAAHAVVRVLEGVDRHPGRREPAVATSPTTRAGAPRRKIHECELLPAARKRVLRDLRTMRKDAEVGLEVEDCEVLTDWVIKVVGAPKTVYEGEIYRLRVRFHPDYQGQPPEVVFMRPAPVHEHIYSDGKICLNILYNDWEPTMDVKSLCLSLLSMLSSAKKKKRPPDNDSTVVMSQGQKTRNLQWEFHDDEVLEIAQDYCTYMGCREPRLNLGGRAAGTSFEADLCRAGLRDGDVCMPPLRPPCTSTRSSCTARRSPWTAASLYTTRKNRRGRQSPVASRLGSRATRRVRSSRGGPRISRRLAAPFSAPQRSRNTDPACRRCAPSI